MTLSVTRHARRLPEKVRTLSNYVREGLEADVQQFEEIFLPRLSQYWGELVLRLRTDRTANIAGSGDLPYEVDVVRFESEEGLVRYSNDEERQRWLHLKDQSVRSAP